MYYAFAELTSSEKLLSENYGTFLYVIHSDCSMYIITVQAYRKYLMPSSGQLHYITLHYISGS